jgi:hypothetical protein
MPIARVVLARDVRRILALPLLLVLTGLSAAGAGLLLGGMAETVGVVAGGIAIAAAILLAVVPLSLRMEVEVGGLRVRWLGGSRRFHLARGPVTRVALTGPSAGSIRSRLPVLGWSLGSAVLRGDERIVLIRLARTPNVIVVPTDAGRLAIAAGSESDLLEALSAAARVQQRLDDVGGRVLAAFPEGLAALEEPAPPAAPSPEERPAPVETERFLTGIERAQLEARLAAAREAALLAAEAERKAALEAAEQAAAGGVTAPVAKSAQDRGEAAATGLSAARLRRAATWSRPAWATDARVRTLGTISWALVPLAASLVAWGLAEANQALAGPDGTWSRLLALGLTLGGPAAALGVVATRTWWPRLTGLIMLGALASLVLTARAVIP